MQSKVVNGISACAGLSVARFADVDPQFFAHPRQHQKSRRLLPYAQFHNPLQLTDKLRIDLTGE